MGNNLLRMGASLDDVFLAIFGLGLAVELCLNALNRREAFRHASLPSRFTGPRFAGLFDAEIFAKARAYTLERLSFDSFSLLYTAAITVVLLFSGVLPWADRLLARTFGDGAAGQFHHGLHHSVLFLAGVTAIQSLTRLPLTLHSTFRIEGRYGFNTMTWDLFWRDLIKGFALSAVLGVPLLYAVFALMGVFGATWWIWAFGLVLAFQIAMMILYPVFIAPLFNRFKPLEDGDLKRDLLGLAARLRFPAGGIYVMDGSRRSLHSNAYFTGFGRLRRIVLFDTLIRQMERPELLSVLAHEIGHYKLKHIYKSMAVQIAMMGVLFYARRLGAPLAAPLCRFRLRNLSARGFRLARLRRQSRRRPLPVHDRLLRPVHLPLAPAKPPLPPPRIPGRRLRRSGHRRFRRHANRPYQAFRQKPLQPHAPPLVQRVSLFTPQFDRTVWR